MTTFLGLDAGGTRTRWVLIDATGGSVRSGEAAAVQAGEMGTEHAARVLRQVLEKILAGLGEVGRPARAVAGVAGAGRAEVRSALEAGAADLVPLAVVGDPEVAAGAVLAEGPGVAVWAGTGSFAIARSERGALLRTGGRGPLLSDEGSAHDLVRRAAVAAVRAADGLDAATGLGEILAARFAAGSATALGAALQRCTPSQIAAAAPDVVAAAADGDDVAAEVLGSGAASLAELADAAARRAGLRPGEIRVELGGGVLQGSAAYAEVATKALRAAGFAGAGSSTIDAAEGAARLAHALADGRAPLCDWVRDGAA